ncbi:MAG: NADPH-dependent reductase [Chitinophagaceae bacterium]|nr:NADPH-dependent reductase [Chitinophagaceae bacterium]
MKIEIVAGSARKNSTSVRVALHLQHWLQDHTDHEIGLTDLREWHLPPLQGVFTSVDNTPEEFKPLSERIFGADAFILVSPEYNGSYSPALKNLLDHFPKQHHKPFAIATASPGAFGGMRATQQLLLLVPALFGVVSPYLLVVPGVDKKFAADGRLLDESFSNSIHNFATEFLWLSEHVVKEKMITH